ncbi:MAG TPA: organic hydroperoxide resistance protein [Acidimicrobiales bacterium]|jgi:Ohr subfamily peroxiredoxin
MADTLYTAAATAWGGREGRAASSDGRVDVMLAIPKEMGGSGEGTNPEQLFATGYAGCFHSALKLVARQRQADVSESAVTVHVSLVANGPADFGIGAAIEAEMPGLDRATAQELLEAAHATCPYSKATRGNIPSTITLVGDYA